MFRHGLNAASVVAVVLGAFLLAAPALAGPSHSFTKTFGAESSTPKDPYPVSGPADVAVDQTSHDLYVTDPGHYRIEKFDPAGHFLLMFGEEVNETKASQFNEPGNPHGITEAEENVCTLASGDTCQPGKSGVSPAAFTGPTLFLAVDNSGGPSTGNIYVADAGDSVVQKFDSSGHLISTWGVVGQKNGSDTPFGWERFEGIDVGPTGNLYVLSFSFDVLIVYDQEGKFLYRYSNVPGVGLSEYNYFFKVDSEGNFYNSAVNFAHGKKIWETNSEDHTLGTLTSKFPTAGFAIDPSTDEVYQNTGTQLYHYAAGCNPEKGECEPLDSFGNGDLFDSQGVAVDGESHTVYVANTETNDVAVGVDIRPVVTTGPPSEVGETSVTLTGHIEPDDRGEITDCHFEYGSDKSYGTTVPCEPVIPPNYSGSTPTDVKATITGLAPDTHDHYRLVAINAAAGSGAGGDQTFTTTAPPAIDGLRSEHLTATTVELIAQINPNQLETRYHIEYGSTTQYGQEAPVVPAQPLAASGSDQEVTVQLANLTPHIVYHYRLVAENRDGTTTTEDHTFDFFPPSCPNASIRQQTQANYLPDCRAYELVSPGNAAGTQLYPGGPNTGHASNPSRFSYTGLFSTIPNSGGSPIDGSGDLYVATRTDTGWVSRYVGLPVTQAAIDGGPPQGPPGSAPGRGEVGVSTVGANLGVGPDRIQNGVLTDPAMNTFLDFNDGYQNVYQQNPTPMASNAPYVWGADGSFRDRWPTNLATVPDGVHTHVTALGELTQIEPGGAHALDCPSVIDTGYATERSFSGQTPYNYCPGDVTASSDLGHFVFATEWNVFAPGGTLSAPGSVYDNNTTTGMVAVASKTPSADAIPSEPSDHAGDPLQIPAVSSDGSHILMASGATGPCGFTNCPTPPCHVYFEAAIRCPMQLSHLYMRVDGVLTYDVSQGRAVSYVGMSADGSKVYFTSEEQLTPDDTDTGTDLYMWSEATDSLTLVSKGADGTGNSDLCRASFTNKCGVVTYSNRTFCQMNSAAGGNCLSDSFIASQDGDIYFFSPEQLDGSRGIANEWNLYDYRGGHVQYVATFPAGPFCRGQFKPICSETPVVRMQVSPDGSHMAFVTANQVTSYDNARHFEMYTYNPSSRNVICVSCIPSGAPPTSDVYASQDGLFMANDGRAFFSTEDALVNTDTNNGTDVYEYVGGRPQLITPGTGDTRQQGDALAAVPPGLVGVSADGRDVYLSTFSTLVSQDQNGNFLKFYDARAGGGFPAPALPPPCNAADECHGPGSLPPTGSPEGTRAALGVGGNVSDAAAHHHKHHRRSHRKRHHTRRANPNRRAGA